MKALETKYNGYRFRSRIEARWAVVFDVLGLEYLYEPEGFDLDTPEFKGRYLPDFYLPTLDTYVEVKGATPDEEARARCSALCEATGKDVWLVAGDIPLRANNSWADEEMQRAQRFTLCPGGEDVPRHAGWDAPYWLCECEVCGRIGIEYTGLSDRIGCGCEPPEPWNGALTPRLLAAYTAGRSARFERGESPERPRRERG